VDKLLSTIDSLAESLKSRKKEENLDEVKLSILLEDVITSLEIQLEKAEGEIVVKKPLDGIVIEGHPTFLTSILQNALDNAIKYRSKERRLEIEIEHEIRDEFVCLMIKDNGIGIDLEKNQERIWGKYNRFTSSAEGTGIGMYLIKGMIEQMGGMVEVRSEVDRFTEIRLYFKMADRKEMEVHE
ncbi:MAG: ATP-binding protein, partial [Flavobacteriales bacterium]|nr:ATP-binding protein [Flavobacteriales bacterium]